ncbi:helix-turn-helix domain-containing protein [Streptomyces alfalfae]
MPDKEECCQQVLTCDLRALRLDVNEVIKLLKILVDERRSEDAPFTSAPAPAPAPVNSRREVLTDRETEVFQLLVTGMSNHQIGRRLGITERTVKNKLHTIYRKIGVSGRAEAIAQHFGPPDRHDGSSD